MTIAEKKKKSRYHHNIRVHRHTAPSSRRSKHHSTAPATVSHSSVSPPAVRPTHLSPPAVRPSHSADSSSGSHEAFQTIQAHVSSMAAAVAAANSALLHPWSDKQGETNPKPASRSVSPVIAPRHTRSEMIATRPSNTAPQNCKYVVVV